MPDLTQSGNGGRGTTIRSAASERRRERGEAVHPAFTTRLTDSTKGKTGNDASSEVEQLTPAPRRREVVGPKSRTLFGQRSHAILNASTPEQRIRRKKARWDALVNSDHSSEKTNTQDRWLPRNYAGLQVDGESRAWPSAKRMGPAGGTGRVRWSQTGNKVVT